MASIQEAKRRLTIEATTRGVDEAKQKLDALAASERNVAAANDQLAVSETRTERSTVSVERALNRVQRQYDATWRSMQAYERAARDLTRAQAQGLITEQRKGELLTMVAARHNQAAAAVRGHAAALNNLRAANQNNPEASNFHTTNLLFQMQDIAMMTAAGQAPHILAMQQGTQVAGIFHQIGNGQQIIQSLKGALLGLLNPISLATIGFIGLGAAAVQYFSSSAADSKTAEEALKRHADLISDIEKRYGRAAEASQRLFSSITSDRFKMADSLRELEFLLREQGGAYRTPNAVGSMWDQMWKGGAGQFDVRFALGAGGNVFPFEVAEGQFKPFEDAILKLFRTAKQGVPDFVEFRKAVLERWNLEPNNEALTKTVRIMMDATEEGTKLTAAFQDLADVQRRLEAGQRGWMIGSPEERERNEYLDNERLSIRNMRRTFDADMATMRARSPRELAAAARGREELRTIDGESDVARRVRIETAERKALAEAEYRLAEAQQERFRALEKALGSQELELSLIGKAAAEAAKLRFEYEQTSQLREQAAKSGVAADERELAMIREKAEAMGRYAEEIARARLSADLVFERSQLGQSSINQQIAMRLRSAGLPLDMNSPEARMMRENMQYQQIHDAFTGFFSSFRSELLANGGDFGDAFAKAFFNSFSKVADEMLGEMTKNFVTALIGMPGQSNGLLGNMLGGFLGGSGGGARGMGGFGNLLAANDNGPLKMIGSTASSAVDLAGNLLGFNETGNRGAINSFLKAGGIDIDAARTAWCAAFVNSSLKQVGVDGSGSLVANSFLDWGKAIDPTDVLRGDVLVQANGRGLNQVGGHVGFATGRSRMGDAGLQLEMLSGNASNMVKTDWRNASALNVRRADEALARFGTTASSASQHLGQFGGGLGQLAQSLMGIGGGMGEGGWFSKLIGMFGSPMGAMGHMMRLSPLVTRFIAGGGVGLFAKGGISDGPAIFGEAGPEAAVPLPDGRRIPVDLRLPNWSAPQAQKVIVESHVVSRFNADGGFDSATERVVQRTAPGIAQRQAVGTVRQYDDQQKRGGAQANDHFFNRLKRQA